MGKRTTSLILSSLILGLLTQATCAAAGMGERTFLHRDRTYEENLRWEASDDKTITPARVLRWLRGQRGSAVFASVTSTQFQPIVNVQNSRVRAVATIAYKF